MPHKTPMPMPVWLPLLVGACSDARAAYLADVSITTARDWRLHMRIAPYRRHSVSRANAAVDWIRRRSGNTTLAAAAMEFGISPQAVSQARIRRRMEGSGE